MPPIEIRPLDLVVIGLYLAGMIAEPIQGVAGFIVPPKEYFEVVVKIIRDHGGILISDEVQTGWGRTGGKWFGIDQFGVVPEVMTGAKGLGNGMPIGMTTAQPEVADSMRFLTLSTFGGNPVTTAAAKAVGKISKEELRPSKRLPPLTTAFQLRTKGTR